MSKNRNVLHLRMGCMARASCTSWDRPQPIRMVSRAFLSTRFSSQITKLSPWESGMTPFIVLWRILIYQGRQRGKEYVRGAWDCKCSKMVVWTIRRRRCRSFGGLLCKGQNTRTARLCNFLAFVGLGGRLGVCHIERRNRIGRLALRLGST